MKGLFVLLLLMLLLSSAAQAGPNDSLAWQLQYGLSGHHTAQPVDYLTWCGDCSTVDYTTGTPWVVNPRTSWPYNLPTFGSPEPGCMWDSDDLFNYVSSGNVLAAGASVGITECIYAGTLYYHPFGLDITSSSPDLRITETWTWDGGSASLTVPPPTFDTTVHLWRYIDCVYTPTAPQTAQLVTIPGSNGGQALPQLMTVNVTNPTSQKIGKTGGQIALDRNTDYYAIGCRSYRQP